MKTLPALTLAPCLLLAFTVACGDSSTGQGGDGSGNGPSSGGSGGNGNTGGAGGIAPAGGNGSGGTPITGPCPSVVSGVPQKICDLYQQNCPNGDTCDIGDADTGNKTFDPEAQCFPQAGLKGISESCNDSPECQAHLTCVGNRCSPFCCPENPDSCGGGLCNVDVDLIGFDDLPTGFKFKACSFSPTCDLFTPDSCPETENCYLSGDAQTTCYEGVDPPVLQGEPCDNLNDCIDSSACVGPQGNSFCYYLCLEDSVAAPGLGGCPVDTLCDINLQSGFPGLGFCH